MASKQSLSQLSHCTYRICYHLVLVTKYRRKVIDRQILSFLDAHFRNVLADWRCALLEFSGEPDHVHLLISAHPNLKVSTLVNNLKTTSSRRVRTLFPKIVSRYYRKPVFWTRAYCVLSAGGAPLETLKRYIQNQDRPRR
jgi:putative transposase